MGLLLCLRAQWGYFIPLVFIATFNRETSILLVLIIPALHWQHYRSVIKPLLLALLAFFLSRTLVLMIVNGMPGHLMDWYFRQTTHTYFEVNLLWLLNEQNILLFLFCLCGLPLFWFAFYDYIPLQYRPLRYVALFCFLSLLLVGIFMEARIFTEISVLLYMPVCVGIYRWLKNLKPYYPSHKGATYYMDRYAVLGILATIVIFRGPLNTWVIWLSHHSL